MTKDSNENSTQSSNFRDQILRDLEKLKTNRLVEESVANLEEKIATDQQLISSEEKRDTTPINKLHISDLSFNQKYVVEEEDNNSAVATNTQLEVDVEDSFETTQPIHSEQPTELKGTSELENTVERNLAELRSLAEGQIESLSKLDSVTDVVPPASNSFSMGDFLAEEVKKEDEATESILADFNSFPVDATGLEETIVASNLSVPVDAEQMPETQARRRTTMKHQRKKQERAAKRIVMTVISVVIITLLITGVTGILYVKACLEPVNVQSTETIQVEIPEGSSTKEIAQILAEKDLIKNATIFNYYAKLKSYNNFQSGYYNLTQSMSVDEISKALQESGSAAAIDPTAGKVLIVEGYTLTQIADAITKNAATEEDTEDTTPFTAEQFMATVQNPDFINRMVATYPNLFASLPAADSGVVYQLEGYLFPAIYEYNSETTIEYLVEQMIAAMNSRLEPYYAQIAEKGQTVNEILTLASLVEKEGSTDEDRRNIASVFYNRIAAEMPLQSNIAILYAMGKLGQETTLAEDTTIDTSIESPYNIYWNTGLMPGPVDSPSLSAIEATINPNTTEYYYFVADVTTGIVYYATNITDHNANVETYVNSHLNN